MEINDNNEAVTCRICGDQCKRIYGKHLKFAHNNMTTVEYKNLFPGAPIMALCDREKTLDLTQQQYHNLIKDIDFENLFYEHTNRDYFIPLLKKLRGNDV